jgi:hypothetical protein
VTNFRGTFFHALMNSLAIINYRVGRWPVSTRRESSRLLVVLFLYNHPVCVLKFFGVFYLSTFTEHKMCDCQPFFLNSTSLFLVKSFYFTAYRFVMSIVKNANVQKFALKCSFLLFQRSLSEPELSTHVLIPSLP